MDERQQEQINEATEKSADALRESFQVVTDRSVSTRELSAKLTQDFFNGVTDNLKFQTESNRALTEDFIEQQRKQREAAQSMARETGNSYTEFLNSMFSYYQGNLDRARDATKK